VASRSDIEAGKAHVTLYAKDAPLMKGLAGVQARLRGLGIGIASVGGMLAGLGASIVTPLIAAVGHFATAGAALDDMAQRTGVAASSLAELGFAAEQSGASINDVEKAIRRMQRTINDAATGLQSATDALDQLGLSVERLAGIPPERQFEMMADALNGIPDPTERAALAMEVFGRSGTMLLPMLGTMRELRAEAQRRGMVPTDEAIAAAGKIDDAFNAIRKTIGAIVFEVGAALGPALLPALHTVGAIAAATAKWVRENAGLVKVIAAVGAGLVIFGGAVTIIGGVVIALGALVGAIPALVAAGPAIVGVLAGVLFTLGIVAGAMGIAKIAVEELDMSITDLSNSFLFLAKNAAEAIVPLGGIVGIIGTVAAPKIEAFTAGLKTASSAIAEQGRAAANSMMDLSAWKKLIDEATESLKKETEVLYDQAAALASLESKRAKRESLVREFESPEERFMRKRAEIGSAMTEVNNQRLLGQITPEQAAAEMHALKTAQARLELAERERRARGGPRPIEPARLPERTPDVAPVVGSPAEIKHSASGTFSAAGALALSFGGGTQQRMLRVAEGSLDKLTEIHKELRDHRPRGPVAG